MAIPDGLEAFTKAFSGLGVDENTLISIVGKAHPEQRKSLRKGSPHLFIEDERQFERWDDECVKLLKQEFMRFKNALVMWSMHPWERDARLAKEALTEGPESYGILVEIACSRSSDELLGARRAYHSLFHQSIEEDIASHINPNHRKLLVALVSAYRYEGEKVKEESAKSEAKILANAIKRNSIEDEEVIRILSTRSKPHLNQLFKFYKDISGNYIHADLGGESIVKETIQCLCTPHKYFSKILDASLKNEADKNTRKALTRVIVTRADADMKEIKEEYQNVYGISLAKKIEDSAKGNYKDFLLTLVARGD